MTNNLRNLLLIFLVGSIFAGCAITGKKVSTTNQAPVHIFTNGLSLYWLGNFDGSNDVYIYADPDATNYLPQWKIYNPNDFKLTPLAEMVKKRDGTNFLGVYMGMIAENCATCDDGSVMMFSATSGECLKWIPHKDFEDIFVNKIRPEYSTNNF